MARKTKTVKLKALKEALDARIKGLKEGTIEHSSWKTHFQQSNASIEQTEDTGSKRKFPSNTKDLPKFDAQNIAGWIAQVKKYFPENFREMEKYIVTTLTSNAEDDLKKGNPYCLISNRWYTSWQIYVERSSGEASNFTRPGKIDNSDIIESESDANEPQLRKNLEEGVDYFPVPQQVWTILVEWYKGGPTIPRKLTCEKSYSESYFVDAYPLCVESTNSIDENITNTRPLSKDDDKQPPKPKLPTSPNYAEKGTRGLVNLGNTCYMNSIIQCLAHTTPIVKYFVSARVISEENPGSLTYEFGKLLRELLEIRHENALSPRQFRDAVCEANTQYKGCEQHDSQEFLIHLLEWLNVSLRRNIFEGVQKSTLVCLKCKKTSPTFGSFTNLAVPINLEAGENYTSLLSCLDDYLKDENIECLECKGASEKKLELWKLPDILVFQLVRFRKINENSPTEKINTKVNFQIHNLDLSSYVTNNDGGSYLYELYAISNHIGTLTEGHYTADAKLMDNNNWYNFDDHRVKLVKDSEIVTAKAYVLFYQRVGSNNDMIQDKLEEEDGESITPSANEDVLAFPRGPVT